MVSSRSRLDAGQDGVTHTRDCLPSGKSLPLAAQSKASHQSGTVRTEPPKKSKEGSALPRKGSRHLGPGASQLLPSSSTLAITNVPALGSGSQCFLPLIKGLNYTGTVSMQRACRCCKLRSLLEGRRGGGGGGSCVTKRAQRRADQS